MLLFIISIIFFLLTIAALISAAETAITATSPGRIQKLKTDGNKKAGILLKLLKTKEKVISTLLVGNSIANTICTTIATGMFIELFGDEKGTIISSMVMSFAIIVFAEVIPKAIAVVKAEKIALIFTPVLVIVLKILEPVNILLFYIVKLFCYIFRIEMKNTVTADEEVRGVIEHHMNEGNVAVDDRDMLGGILDLKSMFVSEAMVHRSNIITVDINTPIDKITKIVFSANHSRIPFWENNQDNIIGVLHVKDLINKIHKEKNNEQDINIRDLLSKPIFVPDNSLLTKQLKHFKAGKYHLACVVDEYGDLQGIITLEDILEEIVGQIYDEHDMGDNKIRKINDSEFLIDAQISVRDLNRELNLKLPEDDATTIAGFIINKMEKIPNAEEKLIFKNLKLIVKNKSDNRINSVKLIISPSEEKNK